jgi:DNA repair protein RecN (Recombination protein N)
VRELEEHDERAAHLDRERAGALDEAATAAVAVAEQRRRAAPLLAAAVQERLRDLAMPRASVQVVAAGDDPADEVEFLLGPNPGEPVLPLAKAASGGELARAMLALRLVLTQGPPTLVFDEVDAGVGGEAALAVGRALASVAEHHQVLVVTHLPQVAAFAHEQVAVTKEEHDGRTVAAARPVRDAERVVELSRMLSGQPASETARGHAEELLATASRQRGG